MDINTIVMALCVCLIITIIGQGTAIEKKLEEINTTLEQIMTREYFKTKE